MDNGKTLYVRLAAHLGDLQGGLAKGSAMISAYGAKADAQMAHLEKYAKTNQKELRTLGNVAGGVGLAAAFSIGLAIRKFAEFDKQMSAVKAATHAGTNEMAALRAEAIKLGADTQFSATEAAQGIEELAKAGISTADILGGGLKGALDLAAAGGLGVGQSAEIAATALTQFNLKGQDIPHLADLLAAGAGKAQGSVTDLGAALGQTGLVASNMGLSIEDTTGSLAAFASAGLLGSDSGTAFKTMIQRLQAPMGRGAKAMEKYGISAYDAQGNFVGITDVAGQLQSKLGGLKQETRDAALAQIFGSDAIRAATVLYKEGSTGIQKWIDKTNDQGYAAETARLRTDNLSGDIERLGGSLDSLFIGMGKGANGPMRDLVQILESIVDVAGSVPDPLLQGAVAALALTAAFGLTVFAASRMVGAVGSTRASLALLNTQTRTAAAGLMTMDRAMMMKNAARGAAGLGMMGLAATDVDNKLGVTNTAAGALLGTMILPGWGTAAGAIVGGIMDISKAADDGKPSIDELTKSLNNAKTFEAQGKALEKLRKVRAALTDASGKPISGFLGDDVDKVNKAINATDEYRFSIQMLEDQTYGAADGVNELFDSERMTKFVSEVGPVLKKVGLDAEQVFKQGPDGANWVTASEAIKDYRWETETTAGKTQTLKGALAGVDDELAGTAGSADRLAKALQGLFSPAMDQDAAMIAWRESLRGLRKELAEGGDSLNNNSEDADKNRTAVMGQVDALTTMLTTAAAAGEGSDELATRLKNGRQAIIDAAVAAGFNADEMSRLLNQYNLTPDIVSTLIEAQGVPKATTDLDTVKGRIRDLKQQIADPKVRLNPDALHKAMQDLATLQGRVNNLDGTYYIRMVTTSQKQPDKPKSLAELLGKDAQAQGGFWPNGAFRAAAQGLYQPTMLRAGQHPLRYGEPETNGESFIPHAMDRRRRATQILGKTASKFGYDLSPRGMSAARGNTVVVQQAGRGPLIGSVTLGSGPRREVRAGLDELEKKLRKMDRGGREW